MNRKAVRQLCISMAPFVVCAVAATVCALTIKDEITNEAQQNCANAVISVVGVLEGFLATYVGILFTIDRGMVKKICAFPGPRMQLYSRPIVPGFVGIATLLYSVVLVTFVCDEPKYPLTHTIILFALLTCFVVGFLMAIIDMITALYKANG